MCRHAYRDSDGSNPKGEDLRTVYPRNAGIREAESDCEDIDEGDRGVACGIQAAAGCRSGRVGNLDVSANEPHGHHHDYSTTDEHLGSTDTVDNKIHGDDDANQANDAVDSGCVKASVGSGQSHGLEDTGRIVAGEVSIRARASQGFKNSLDRVRASKLHEDHDNESQSDAFAVAGVHELSQS